MLKRHNKQVILDRLKERAMTRIELATLTGLSNSTVSALTAELAEDGIIFEEDIAKSSGGRRPVIFSLNSNSAYTLLIKILSKKMIFCVVDIKLQIVFEKSFALHNTTKTDLDTAVCLGIDRVFRENRKWRDSLVGIGVSVSGVVDHADHAILYSSTLNIANYNIKATIQSKIDKPVYVFKDTDSSLLGEYILNSLRDDESYVYLFVESGVGMSFMNKGEIMQLNRGGLEIGHIKIESDGPRCDCGKCGCVESFLSEQAAIRDYKDLLCKSGRPQTSEDERITLEKMIEKSACGDELCAEVIHNQCRFLGRVAAMIVNIFAPSEVIIGGPIANVSPAFQNTALSSYMENVLQILDNARLRFTDIGNKASIIGMANHIFNEKFFTE